MLVWRGFFHWSKCFFSFTKMFVCYYCYTFFGTQCACMKVFSSFYLPWFSNAVCTCVKVFSAVYQQWFPNGDASSFAGLMFEAFDENRVSWGPAFILLAELTLGRVTTWLENREMSGNFTAVRENVRDFSENQGNVTKNNLVRKSCPQTFLKLHQQAFWYSVPIILCCLSLNFAYLCFGF